MEGMSKRVYTITVERECDTYTEVQHRAEVSGWTVSRLLSDVQRRYPEADGWVEWNVCYARTFSSDVEAAEWCSKLNYLDELTPIQIGSEWCAMVKRTGRLI